MIRHTQGYVSYTPTDVIRRLDSVEKVAAASFGSATGVIRTDDSLYFLVMPTTPPSMSVIVRHGLGVIGSKVVEQANDTQLALSTPITQGRKDLVQYTLGVGCNVKRGDESESPVAPTEDDDSILLAVITLAPDTTEITTALITDTRKYV